MKLNKKNVIYYIIIAVLAYLIYTKWQNVETFSSLAPAPKDLSKMIGPGFFPLIKSINMNASNNTFQITFENGHVSQMPKQEFYDFIFNSLIMLRYTRQIDLFKRLKSTNELGKRLLDEWKYYKSLWQNQNHKENEARLKDTMTKVGLYGSKKEQSANTNALNKMRNMLKNSTDLSVLKSEYDKKYLVPIKYLHEKEYPEKLSDKLSYLPILVAMVNSEIIQINAPEGFVETRITNDNIKLMEKFLLKMMISYSIFRKKNVLLGVDKLNAKNIINEFDRMKTIGHRELYKENEKRVKALLKMLGAM